MLSVRVFEVFVDSHWPGSCLLECDNIGKRETIPDLLVYTFCFGKKSCVAFSSGIPNRSSKFYASLFLEYMGIHEYLRIWDSQKLNGIFMNSLVEQMWHDWNA